MSNQYFFFTCKYEYRCIKSYNMHKSLINIISSSRNPFNANVFRLTSTSGEYRTLFYLNLLTLYCEQYQCRQLKVLLLSCKHAYQDYQVRNSSLTQHKSTYTQTHIIKINLINFNKNSTCIMFTPMFSSSIYFEKEQACLLEILQYKHR